MSEKVLKIKRDSRPLVVDGSEKCTRRLTELYPAPTSDEILTASPELDEWIEIRLEAAAEEKAAKERKAEADNHIRQAIGARMGVSSAAGDVFWPVTAPSTNWKDLALHFLDKLPAGERAALQAEFEKPGYRKLSFLKED